MIHMKAELLIAGYLDAVWEAICEVLDDYSCEDDPPEEDPVYDLLGAWREGLIPASGVLPSGRSFWFHGHGCRFEHQGRVLEMDFTPEGSCDGFDAWRLYLFSTEHPELGGLGLEEIESALKELESVGVVRRCSDARLYAPAKSH